MNDQLVFLLVAGVAGVWAFFRWRQALQAALVLLVLEGAIRKWALPGAQQYVYFGKDILLLGCYVGCMFHAPGLLRRVPKVAGLNALLMIAAAYGLVQILNPSLPSVLVGLLGFKSYFLYVPLLVIVPAAFRDGPELGRFLRRYALLAIPVALLAAYQFRSPAASAVNVYAWAPEAGGPAITFGSSTAVRVTGTFSFITGYSTYTFVAVVLVLTLLAVARWRWRGNWSLYVALGLTLVGMLMTGSRAPVLTLALVFPLYLWFSILRERGGGEAAGRMLLLVALGGVFVGQAFAPAAEAFFVRATSSTDTPGRIVSPFTDPAVAYPVGGFFGLGIGSTHQAATHLVGERTSISPFDRPLFEGESGRVVVELGLVGFLMLYLARVALVVIAFRHVRHLRQRAFRAVATASLLVLLVSLPSGIVFNVTAGVYYWFFAGLLMLAVKLDREAATVAATGAPPPVPLTQPADRQRWLRR